MMMAQQFSAQISSNLSGASEKRRDIWTSKQEAYTIMKSRETWKKWDDRALKIYTVGADLSHISPWLLIYLQNYGLRSLPTAAYPDLTEGVTLTCTRAQEAVCLCRSATHRTFKAKISHTYYQGMLQRCFGIIPRIYFASPHCTEGSGSYHLWGIE